MTKVKHKCLFLYCVPVLFIKINPHIDQKDKKTFNISWLREEISYHIYIFVSNNLMYTSPQKSGGESYPMTKCIENTTVLIHPRLKSIASKKVNAGNRV